MAADILTILIVLSLGLLAGTIAGLFLGYVFKTQKRDWHDMTKREIGINIALVAACSAIGIAGLAWYAFR